jgi:hypothetical protein
MPNVPTSHAARESSILVKAARLKAESKRILLADIRQTWGKFDDDELADLKDIDHLVSQLVLKYGMDNEHARRGADDLVGGRSF